MFLCGKTKLQNKFCFLHLRRGVAICSVTIHEHSCLDFKAGKPHIIYFMLELKTSYILDVKKKLKRRRISYFITITTLIDGRYS